jgi:hypothetical protein
MVLNSPNRKDIPIKNVILGTATALSFCAILSVSILCAQANGAIVANVPFDFTVLDQHLSAGRYTVMNQTAQNAILIEGEQDGTAMFVLTLPVQATKIQKHAKLVFRRYGDEYFLSKIWYAGTHQGHELSVSNVEQEVARNMPKPEETDLLVAGSKQRKPVR